MISIDKFIYNLANEKSYCILPHFALLYNKYCEDDKMSNGFGSDYVTISDDDGNDYVLEYLDTIELDDELYMAFLPTDIDEDDEGYGFVILQVVEEDGEELLATVDDDDLLDDLYDRFMERIQEEDS